MEVPATETSSLRERGRFYGGDGAETAVSAPGKPRTGLVIDDTPSSRRQAVRLLETDGYRVVTATSYDQAFWLVSVWRPEVVVVGIKWGSAAFVEKLCPLYEPPMPLADFSYTPA